MQHSDHDNGARGFFASRANIVLVGFLLIGGYFLVTEHWAHLLPFLSFLPWLFLLACPLMHFFMHGGHGGDHDKGDRGGGTGVGGSDQAHRH